MSLVNLEVHLERHFERFQANKQTFTSWEQTKIKMSIADKENRISQCWGNVWCTNFRIGTKIVLREQRKKSFAERSQDVFVDQIIVFLVVGIPLPSWLLFKPLTSSYLFMRKNSVKQLVQASSKCDIRWLFTRENAEINTVHLSNDVNFVLATLFLSD